MAQYYNVVFTLNNPEGLIDFDAERMGYLIYQEEVGESGTHHFQGYLELKNKLALSAVKVCLGSETVHIERRRGTQQQAIDYCKKEDGRVGGPYEFGERKVQGKRVDLDQFRTDVFAGKRKRDFNEDNEHVMQRFPRYYDLLTSLNRPVRETDIKVTLLIGETGLGKSRYVYDKFSTSSEFYILPLDSGTLWFNGYDRHEVVLMDDFSGAVSHMPLSSLLRLLDRYPLQVPTKGGFTWWLPNEVYVTTNLLPKNWYKWENRLSQYRALARRFSEVIVFEEDVSTVETGVTWWEENAPSQAIHVDSGPNPYLHAVTEL